MVTMCMFGGSFPTSNRASYIYIYGCCVQNERGRILGRSTILVHFALPIFKH